MKYRHEFEAAPPPSPQVRPILFPLCVLLLVGVIVFAVSQSVALKKIRGQQDSEARGQIEELQKELKALKEAKAAIEKERDEEGAKARTLQTELAVAAKETDRLRNVAETSKAAMEKTRLKLLKSTEELKASVAVLSSRFDNPISGTERKEMQDKELTVLKEQVNELLKALSGTVDLPSK
jgi:septal ring factor EnvC (AmiA/AmiB activator)